MAGKTNRLSAIALVIALLGMTNLPAWAQRPSQNSAAITVRDDQAEDNSLANDDLEASLTSATLALQPPASTVAPPPATIPRVAPTTTPTRGPRGSRQANTRLASAPDMFGDFFQTGGDLLFRANQNSPGVGLPPTFGSISIPSAGGSRRVKIAENNKAMPDNRLIFSFNHFENALQFSETPLFNPTATNARQFPIDRYTIGIEKMFLDDRWSCEVRMPFQSSFGFQTADIGGAGGQIGNLAVILKRLMYVDEDLAIVAGMGIDMPTGSDFTLTDGAVGQPAPLNQIIFRNDSLHLLPYAGFLWGGDRSYFVNAFLQVDLAANGNRVDVGQVGAPTTTLGRYTEQNLLFADLGTGYWLYRDPFSESRLTSLAAILELHYTSSMQDADTVAGIAGGRPIVYTNRLNRFDILNITTGVQAQLFNTTSLRVAGVFPLGSAPDRRFFDSELQVQINRRF